MSTNRLADLLTLTRNEGGEVTGESVFEFESWTQRHTESRARRRHRHRYRGSGPPVAIGPMSEAEIGRAAAPIYPVRKYMTPHKLLKAKNQLFVSILEVLIRRSRKRSHMLEHFLEMCRKHNKHYVYTEVMTSHFLEETVKYQFKHYFQKAMRVLLYLRGKHFKKCEVFDNDTDMNLEPLCLHAHKVMLVRHCHRIYKFNIHDVIKIIRNALYFAEGLFHEPQEPKNPFNNKSFTKTHLYNIYFHLRFSGMKIPEFYQLFYKADFDIKRFSDDNCCFLRNEIIKNLYNDATLETKYEAVVMMLRRYNLVNATIHPTFSKKAIVEAFEEYLVPHTLSQYSHDTILARRSYKNTKIALANFFYVNPLFGQVFNEEAKALETQYTITNLISDEIPQFTDFQDLLDAITFEPYSDDDEGDYDDEGEEGEEGEDGEEGERVTISIGDQTFTL